MKKANKKEILAALYKMASMWRSQFDSPPELKLSFSVAPVSELLTLNGIELCPVCEVDLEDTYFDIEYLVISTITGDRFDIFIDWPYDGPAKISRVDLISTVFYST